MGTTKEIILRGNIRTMGEAVEAWKQAHDEAERVRQIEDIIPALNQMCAILREWRKDFWDSLFAGEFCSSDIDQCGGLLGWAYTATLDLLGQVGGSVRWATERGYTVDNAGILTQLQAEVERWISDHKRRCPFTNTPEMHRAVEQGRAQVARGEYVTPEDMRRELLGQDRP
jgi:hypothetical protein